MSMRHRIAALAAAVLTITASSGAAAAYADDGSADPSQSAVVQQEAPKASDGSQQTDKSAQPAADNDTKAEQASTTKVDKQPAADTKNTASTTKVDQPSSKPAKADTSVKSSEVKKSTEKRAPPASKKTSTHKVATTSVAVTYTMVYKTDATCIPKGASVKGNLTMTSSIGDFVDGYVDPGHQTGPVNGYGSPQEIVDITVPYGTTSLEYHAANGDLLATSSTGVPGSCATTPSDSDNDGIADSADTCPNTDKGAMVDENGCAANQRDSDDDGVKDDADKCVDQAGPASNDGCPVTTPPQCTNLTGAIFTTDPSGDVVNGNIYASKSDVYLQGGPDKKGAHLPDGTYYYRVTDPSGKTVLSDTRTVTVTNNVFPATQLAPFDDTPNNGGEYKVWLSTSPDFENHCTKTDNFKVKEQPKTPVTVTWPDSTCVAGPNNDGVGAPAINPSEGGTWKPGTWDEGVRTDEVVLGDEYTAAKDTELTHKYVDNGGNCGEVHKTPVTVTWPDSTCVAGPNNDGVGAPAINPSEGGTWKPGTWDEGVRTDEVVLGDEYTAAKDTELTHKYVDNGGNCGVTQPEYHYDGSLNKKCVTTSDGAFTGMTSVELWLQNHSKNVGDELGTFELVENIDGTVSYYYFDVAAGEELTLYGGYTAENGEHVALVLNGPADAMALDTLEFDTADCAAPTPPPAVCPEGTTWFDLDHDGVVDQATECKTPQPPVERCPQGTDRMGQVKGDKPCDNPSPVVQKCPTGTDRMGQPVNGQPCDINTVVPPSNNAPPNNGGVGTLSSNPLNGVFGFALIAMMLMFGSFVWVRRPSWATILGMEPGRHRA